MIIKQKPKSKQNISYLKKLHKELEVQNMGVPVMGGGGVASHGASWSFFVKGCVILIAAFGSKLKLIDRIWV